MFNETLIRNLTTRERLRYGYLLTASELELEFEEAEQRGEDKFINSDEFENEKNEAYEEGVAYGKSCREHPV